MSRPNEIAIADNRIPDFLRLWSVSDHQIFTT